jgi:nicotinate-nucleotide adenylyltransferase
VKTGLLGGTFDPIHNGHLAAAEAALRCAQLDRVLLVPAAVPPHRPPALAPAADRLELCRLAVQGKQALDVWDVEINRPGPSYTVDTLAEFRKAFPPDDEPYLILGWDAARDLRSWHDWRRLLDLARLIVLGRPGLPLPTPEELAAITADGATLCTEPTPDVEATEIRRRAAAGESLAGMVPPQVESYIREHRLYSGHNRAVG